MRHKGFRWRVFCIFTLMATLFVAYVPATSAQTAPPKVPLTSAKVDTSAMIARERAELEKNEKAGWKLVS
ncbi:hypothetical protein [Nitrolancea hollandica]|uniref:Secreted protein n=1 Tax=Nitrolancea hollandica Lb TaxID=1129897 RepID=I4EKA2_9BACT|nr:hypothetical protein [Nitrolancea hollandica]CCF85114.1 exported hypothetical protein [Nitrolancea hollandica Lb]